MFFLGELLRLWNPCWKPGKSQQTGGISVFAEGGHLKCRDG